MKQHFPKTCKVCKTVFQNYEDFLLKTKALPKGDFSKGPKDSVLIYRNCSCGTTLTTRVDDRRDYSDKGQKQREKFKKILDNYLARGISLEEAKRLTKEDLGL